jgi:hypothetical protein
MDLVSRISDLATAIGNAIKGKQDILVSGDTIKTLNGASLLGSGNINISGGSGSQTLYIQETEPTINQGENVMWVMKSTNGDVTINLVEGL